MIEIEDDLIGPIRWYPNETYRDMLIDGQTVKIIQAHLHTSLLIILGALRSESLTGESLADIEEAMNSLIEKQRERFKRRTSD